MESKDSDLRSKFLSRISSVGWGTRESIQMVVGGVVSTIRNQVVDGVIAEEEMEVVVSLHDAAEKFWQASMATNPLMSTDQLITGLRQLNELCVGPVAGFRVDFEMAIGQAQRLARAKGQPSE